MVAEGPVDGSGNRSIYRHSVVALLTEVPQGTRTRHHKVEESYYSLYVPDKSEYLEPQLPFDPVVPGHPSIRVVLLVVAGALSVDIQGD